MNLIRTVSFQLIPLIALLIALLTLKISLFLLLLLILRSHLTTHRHNTRPRIILIILIALIALIIKLDLLLRKKRVFKVYSA